MLMKMILMTSMIMMMTTMMMMMMMIYQADQYLVLTIFNEGAYLTFKSQSYVRPSIYFSLIVNSRSKPFLKPTSTEQ